MLYTFPVSRCSLCTISVHFTFPATEPGVPYNITVRASTAAGKGEPVSIVVFTVQQGNILQTTMHMYFKVLWHAKLSMQYNKMKIRSCIRRYMLLLISCLV